MQRGLRIVRGYVQVRIVHQGRYYHKNFGPDCPLAREIALEHLVEKRKEIRNHKFGIIKELPTRKFKEVANEYYERWSTEKDAEGKLAHGSGDTVSVFLRGSIGTYFNAMDFDQVRPLDVLRWREKRLKTVLGTSVNREQAVLSSIFSHVERWVKTEAIPAFKIPAENPCTSVEKAPTRKRKRVLSTTELKALKAACYALKDEDMWEICTMALKSLLRKKDLAQLEAGLDIDTVQTKTRREIQLPILVSKPLIFKNFRKRWEAVRKAARLEDKDVQFRDMRKTGNNLLKMMGHSQKVRQEILGHASQRTTEIYDVPDQAHLKKPLDELEKLVEGL